MIENKLNLTNQKRTWLLRFNLLHYEKCLTCIISTLLYVANVKHNVVFLSTRSWWPLQSSSIEYPPIHIYIYIWIISYQSMFLWCFLWTSLMEWSHLLITCPHTMPSIWILNSSLRFTKQINVPFIGDLPHSTTWADNDMTSNDGSTVGGSGEIIF